MLINNNSDKEYQEFIGKFMKTCAEIQQDFSKLSAENKLKFQQEVKLLMKAGFPDLLQFIQS